MELFAFTWTNIFLWLLGVFIVSCYGFYRYMCRNDDYWKNRNISYEPRRSWYSLYKDYGTKDYGAFEIERYRKYGRIYGYFEGAEPHLTVSEPGLLKDILIKDFDFFSSRRVFDFYEPVFSNFLTSLSGEDWRRVRTIVTPAFTSAKMRKIALIIDDCTKTLVENFLRCAESGTPTDVKKLFGAFTMDVIARSAFATRINSHEDPDNPFVTNAKDIFSKNAKMKTLAFFLLHARIRKFFGLLFLDQKSCDFLKNVTLQVIEERQRTGQKGNDFLQLMMDAYKENVEARQRVDGFTAMEDDTDVYGDKEVNTLMHKTIYENKSLSRDELISQCLVFYIAGYETTAATFSFLAYNLALHPEIQEKLIEEVDTVTAEHDRLDYDSIKEIKYLDLVLKETLRLYPPTMRSERTAVSRYSLRDKNITVEKGMLVGFPIYAMHHDPEFFTDPEKFDPDRFLPGSETYTTLAYLPFGAGPRHCVGMRFAEMEIKLCVANVLRYVRFKTCPETQIPVEFQPTQGLLTPRTLVLKVEKRTDILPVT